MPKIKVPTSALKRPAKVVKPPLSSPCKPEKAPEPVKEKKNCLKMKERLRDLLKEMSNEVRKVFMNV